MDKINILIAMPIYRQSLYIQTLVSLLSLKDKFAESEIASSFIYVDSFDVVSARNMMATYFVNNRAYTHLLFVDDDMSFSCEAIIELLRLDQAFTACISPKRGLDCSNIYAAALQGKSLDQSVVTSLEFVVTHKKAEKLVVERNFCKLKSIGMAVTLLRRDAFELMIEKNVVEKINLEKDKQKDYFGNTFNYGFFNRIYDEDLQGWYGEDFSFCKRWTEDCKGEIYGLATAKIGHVGTFVFEGRYIDSLEAGKL